MHIHAVLFVSSAGYIVSRATQTVSRGRDLAIRTARQPPEQQADYYYRNLLGPDWEQQLQQASKGHSASCSHVRAAAAAFVHPRLHISVIMHPEQPVDPLLWWFSSMHS
jgi:hypothetical protein